MKIDKLMMPLRFHFFMVVFGLSCQSFASNDNSRTWLGAFQKTKISESLTFQNETQIRFNNDTGRTQQLLIRPQLLRRLNPTQEIGYLLGIIQTGNTVEYRPTLQLSQSLADFGESKWNLRSRIEFRHLENETRNAGRLRLQLVWQRIYKSDLTLLIWNEVFLHLFNTEWTGTKTFDRNRTFIGSRVHLENYFFDVGYLNQYIENSVMKGAEHGVLFYLYF